MVYPATPTPGLNWVYWTLAFELAFYVVTMAAVVGPRVFPWLGAALAALPVVPGLADVPGLFWLANWPHFAVGVGLSLWKQRRRAAAGAVLGAAAAATAVLFGPHVWLAAGLAAAVIVWPRDTAPGPLTRLGLVSYSLYLLHVPIGCWLLLEWKRGPWQSDPWLNLAYDLGVSAVCVWAAVAFWWAVERPCLALGRWPHARPTARRPG